MPNPADNNTAIQYSLKNAGAVSIMITDITGKVVYTSNEGNKAAGNHTVNVNTENMTAGVYFYTLTVDGVSVTNKMTVAH